MSTQIFNSMFNTDFAPSVGTSATKPVITVQLPIVVNQYNISLIHQLFEDGKLTNGDLYNSYMQYLVDTGLVWELSRSAQRSAIAMLKTGLLQVPKKA